MRKDGSLKTVLICAVIVVIAMVYIFGEKKASGGNTSSGRDYEGYDNDEIYDWGYEEGNREGYERGYREGMKYAIESLRDNAYDWDMYMNVEDIDESIHRCFEDYGAEADNIRDMIIYHPDFKRYSLEELLEKLIDESIPEGYMTK